MVDLGPHARTLVSACWVAAQAALVLTAPLRPDRIFAFRMFPESSTIEIHLSRETGAGPVVAPRGEWSARDRAGQLRHFSWHERVRDSILGSLDERVFASYGVETQLARLQRALDDVAEHTAEDEETLRLRADVFVRKNGREPVTVTLLSHPRREAREANLGPGAP